MKYNRYFIFTQFFYFYFRSSKPDQLFVDCSTISPESSKKVSDMAQQKGCKFLGAPVSGGIYIYHYYYYNIINTRSWCTIIII